MQAPTPRRAVSALALALCLLAAPALAAPTAPSTDGLPRAAGVFDLLADWWAGVTQPLVALFAPNGHDVDPDGGPTATTAGDDPTADSESRHTIDPNG